MFVQKKCLLFLFCVGLLFSFNSTSCSLKKDEIQNLSYFLLLESAGLIGNGMTFHLGEKVRNNPAAGLFPKFVVKGLHLFFTGLNVAGCYFLPWEKKNKQEDSKISVGYAEGDEKVDGKVGMKNAQQASLPKPETKKKRFPRLRRFFSRK